MGNPANVAQYGHRQSLWLLNTTTGSQGYIDRVQSVEPSFNIKTDTYSELGRKGKIGATQAPPEYRISFEQMMTNSLEAEWILAGKSLSTDTSYNAGDFLTNASLITAYVASRNNDGTMLSEEEFTGCSVAEIAYSWRVGEAIKQTFNLVGKQGKSYQAAAMVHSSWGALDDTSLGGVNAKDARVWFTSGSTATDRGYRLQSLNIRVTYPNVYVNEIGSRALAGTLNDAPDITVDFDLLRADQQPLEKFFTLTSQYYDFQNPVTAFNMFVRVFNPNSAEGTDIIKMFKVHNVLPTSVTPIRAQVRGLTTARYSLVMSKEAVADSGGLEVSTLNDLV